MHPAVHIANPAEWPGGAIGGMDDCPGTWRASSLPQHDGWLDRPDLTRTRSVRGEHTGGVPVTALHWRPTPSGPWPQRKGGSRSGAVAAPVPRPRRLQCHAASVPWCRGDWVGRMCLAHRRGTAEQPSQLSQGARRRGDKRSPTIRTRAQRARLTKNLANVSGDHTALPERIFGSK